MAEVLAKIAEIDGLVAALITGIITFLITKYTYHKSIPLDKLEIAYNRVYYPICNLIQNDNNTEIIEKSEKYLNKYKKYVDRSTVVAYKLLVKSPDDEKACNNFKNNIYAINTRLRRRLGYLEPNILTMYTYSAPNDKRILRILMELAVAYISIGVYSLFDNVTIQQGTAIIFVISSIFFVIEIAVGIIIWLKNKLKEFMDNVRER